jgi:WD40 repeat protein
MQQKAQDMMKAMKEEYGDNPPSHGFTFGEEGGVARGWRVGEAGRLTIWRLPAGTPEVSWDLEEGAPYLLAFSADGTALASVGRGVQAWDLAGKRRLPPDRFPAHWQGGPGFTPQGRTILVPEKGRTAARVWDAGAGREVLALDQERSWGPFAFSPEGDRLAVTYGRDTVEIREAATGRELLPLPRHPAWIGGLALAAAAPVAAVVSGGVHLWDRATGAELRRLGEHCSVPALSSDGTRLAGVVRTSAGETNVVVWNCQDGRRLTELEGLEPAALLFLDGSTLLVGNALGQVGRYDLAAGRWVKVLRGAEGTVDALAVAPCGQLVAGGSTDGVVRLWRLNTGEALRELPVPAASGESAARPARLAFSPDGTQLGWAAPPGRFLLWDSSTGKLIGKLQLSESVDVCAIGFDARGRCLAAETTAVSDETSEFRLRLWDPRGGKPVFTTEPQPQPITQIVFTADRRHIATAGADRTVLFWDVNKL